MAETNPSEGEMFDRLMKPGPDELFFHYCSTETFRVICETKTLRFSDINMMNDYAETAYGYDVFIEAANRLLEMAKTHRDLDGLDAVFLDEVDEIFGSQQLFVHPVMCSFSKKPDVLSQWRAYADDGSGVAIGFTGAALSAMPVSVVNVEYDRETQIKEMTAMLAAIYSVEAKSGHKRDADFKRAIQTLSAYRLAYKNSAFFEEQEVRCLHLLDINWEKQEPTLVDAGGSSNGKDVPGVPVKFRTREGGVIAYVDLPLELSQTPEPIKQIWLGPRNDNGPGNIVYMMGGYGFFEYEIFHSTASYRR